MADPNIKIGIQTTGAPEAAGAFRKTGESLGDLGKKSTRAAEGVRGLGKETERLGKGGNAGAAVLEFSRAFEDAQYGIRGVLNNIPLLIASLGGSAGLAGVISIAAVAGTQLWERMQGGTKSAKDELDDYKNAIDAVREAYAKQFDKEEEIREQSLKKIASDQREAVASARSEGSLASMRAGLEYAQTKANTQVELARERVKLAELEQQSITASGQEAVRLANERLAKAQRIAEVEARARDEARAFAIQQAEIKKSEAQTRFDAAKESDTDTAKKRVDAQAQLSSFSSERAAIAADRMETVRLYSQEIEKLKQDLTTLMANPPVFGNEQADAAWRQRQQDLADQITAKEKDRGGALAETQRERDLGIAIGELTPKLKSLTDEVAATAEAQREAARELTETTRSLRFLRETQGVERGAEKTVDSIQSGGANDPAIQQAGRNITDAVTQAIGMIQGNAHVNNRPMTSGESEAVAEASKLLADSTPDSQQGAQLMAILQKLSGNLTEKDAALIGGLNQIIHIVGSQVDAILKIQERINALAAKVAQIGKITDDAMKTAQEAKTKAETAEAQSKFATAESIKAAGQKAAAAAADAALAVAITKQLR